MVGRVPKINHLLDGRGARPPIVLRQIHDTQRFCTPVAVGRSQCRGECPSNHNGHRLNHHRRRCDSNALDSLRRNHDPQRLDAPAVTAEVGSIVGRHRPCRFLLRQILHNDRGPSWVEHLQNLATIDAVVSDYDQRLTVTTHHAGAGHRAPSPPAPSRPIPNVAQTASQPSNGVQ
jgi:hypothetical protein